MAANDDEEPSYIDYETFLSPDFSPSSFANTLVLATNNPNDAPLDLSTPLSRVLFDIQEIDSHIDVLTTRSAVPLLSYTKEQNDASGRIVTEIESQVKSLNDSYKQLEKEVIQKHAEADEVRKVATRLWEALRVGRSLNRCLQLGRQLEIQHAELSPAQTSKKEDHRALVRAALTILSLREILERKEAGQEGYGLDSVAAIRSLQDSVILPIERSVKEAAERMVREFSVGSASGSATFAQSEDIKARTLSALATLYLLSPTALARNQKWSPTLMLKALKSYLEAALQSSTASMSRSLATLPTLDRTLAEISARCQNIVALELVLESTKAPVHPFASILTPSGTASDKGNLLQPLLADLETGSLVSYFWRTLAGSLSSRVHEIVNQRGVSSRNLKANKNHVRDAIRDCVLRGVQAPSTVASTVRTKGKADDAGKGATWDREVAVMVGSIMGPLER